MPTRKKQSNAPPLARPATVVRYRRHVADRGNRKASRLPRAQRRLTSRARARHLDFEGTHAVLLRLLGGIFCRDLGSVGRRLARALETHGPGRGPGNRVALRVGDRNHRVVERSRYMRDAWRDVLAFAPADASSFLTHSQSF